MPPFILSNELPLPEIGFGVFRIPDGRPIINAVHQAIHCGYRNFDTAMLYHNESGLGQALIEHPLERETFSVTTKVWNTDQGYNQTISAFEASLQRLKMNYVDLYLVHWPVQSTLESTWRAMEHIYRSGRARAIGVCNFSIAHLKHLLQTATIPPMVNQIEFHPCLQSPALVNFCQSNDILVQAWAPIMRGQAHTLPTLQKIAAHHKTTAAAISLSWIRSAGIMPLPKSQTPERIQANIDALKIILSDDEREQIRTIGKTKRLGPTLEQFWNN